MGIVHYLFVVLAQLSFFGQCEENPTISYVSEEQIQDLGSSAELVCKVQNAQDHPVLWLKLGEDESDMLIISTGGSLVIQDSRYSMRTDLSMSTFALRIENIQEPDAGIYQCQIVIDVNTRVKEEVNLKLRLPPIFSDNSTKSLVVGEKQSAQLECYADGYPKPEVSWRREDSVKLPNGYSIVYGNVLKIDRVLKEHRGVYYCVANNGVGDRASRRTVSLEVEFAPLIDTKQSRLSQAQKYDTNLVCHVIAFPPPHVTWHKDQERLINDRHHAISLHSTFPDDYDSILRVINIDKTHFGDYICRASNSIGTSEIKFNLSESKTPVCPPVCAPVVNSTTPNQENETTTS